jgi:hypothetical protein
VELDVVLAVVRAQEPPDVLDDPTLEREGEGEEERVALGPVEALPKIRAGGDEHDPRSLGPGGDGVGDRGSGLLTETALEHEGPVAELGEPFDDGIDTVYGRRVVG